MISSRYGRVLVIASYILLLPLVPVEAAVDEWTSQGPPGGRITDFAVDPSTPSTLFFVTIFPVAASMQMASASSLTQ